MAGEDEIKDGIYTHPVTGRVFEVSEGKITRELPTYLNKNDGSIFYQDEETGAIVNTSNTKSRAGAADDARIAAEKSKRLKELSDAGWWSPAAKARYHAESLSAPLAKGVVGMFTGLSDATEFAFQKALEYGTDLGLTGFKDDNEAYKAWAQFKQSGGLTTLAANQIGSGNMGSVALPLMMKGGVLREEALDPIKDYASSHEYAAESFNQVDPVTGQKVSNWGAALDPSFIYNTTMENVPQMIPGMAAGKIAGGWAAVANLGKLDRFRPLVVALSQVGATAATTFPGEFSSAKEEAYKGYLKQGFSPEESERMSNNVGAAYGAISSILEGVGDKFVIGLKAAGRGVGLGSTEFKEALKAVKAGVATEAQKAIVNELEWNTKGFLRGFAKGAIEEFPEEFFQNVTQDALFNAAAVNGPLDDKKWSDIFKDALFAGLTAMWSGGITGGVVSPSKTGKIDTAVNSIASKIEAELAKSRENKTDSGKTESGQSKTAVQEQTEERVDRVGEETTAPEEGADPETIRQAETTNTEKQDAGISSVVSEKLNSEVEVRTQQESDILSDITSALDTNNQAAIESALAHAAETNEQLASRIASVISENSDVGGVAHTAVNNVMEVNDDGDFFKRAAPLQQAPTEETKRPGSTDGEKTTEPAVQQAPEQQPKKPTVSKKSTAQPTITPERQNVISSGIQNSSIGDQAPTTAISGEEVMAIANAIGGIAKKLFGVSPEIETISRDESTGKIVGSGAISQSIVDEAVAGLSAGSYVRWTDNSGKQRHTVVIDRSGTSGSTALGASHIIAHEFAHAIARNLFVSGVTKSPVLATRFINDLLASISANTSGKTTQGNYKLSEKTLAKSGRFAPGTLVAGQYGETTLKNTADYFHGAPTKEFIEAMREAGMSDAEIISKLFDDSHQNLTYADEYLAEQVGHYLLTAKIPTTRLGALYKSIADAIKNFLHHAAGQLGFNKNEMINEWVDQFAKTYANTSKKSGSSSKSGNTSVAIEEANKKTEEFLAKNKSADEVNKYAEEFLGNAENKKSIESIAASLARRLGVPVDDAIQAAHLGLLQAIKTFDPSKGAAIMTHIYSNVNAAVMDMAQGFHTTMSGLTEQQQRDAKYVNDLITSELKKTGETPSIDDLTAALNIRRMKLKLSTLTAGDVRELIHGNNIARTLGVDSLDRGINTESGGGTDIGMTLGELTPDTSQKSALEVASEAEQSTAGRVLSSILDRVVESNSLGIEGDVKTTINTMMSDPSKYLDKNGLTKDGVELMKLAHNLETDHQAQEQWLEIKDEMAYWADDLGLSIGWITGRSEHRSGFGGFNHHEVVNGIVDYVTSAYNLYDRNITGYEAMTRLIQDQGEKGVHDVIQATFPSATPQERATVLSAYRLASDYQSAAGQRVYGANGTNVISDTGLGGRVVGIPLRGVAPLSIGRIADSIAGGHEQDLRGQLGLSGRRSTSREVVDKLRADSEAEKVSRNKPKTMSLREAIDIISGFSINNKNSAKVTLPSGRTGVAVWQGNRLALGIDQSNVGNGDPAFLLLTLFQGESGIPQARVEWSGIKESNQQINAGVASELYSTLAATAKKIGIEYITGDLAGDYDGNEAIIGFRLRYPSTALINDHVIADPVSDDYTKPRASYFAATHVDDIIEKMTLPLDRNYAKSLATPWGKGGEYDVDLGYYKSDHKSGFGPSGIVETLVNLAKRPLGGGPMYDISKNGLKDMDIHMQDGKLMRNISSSFGVFLRDGAANAVTRLFEQESHSKNVILHSELGFRDQLSTAMQGHEKTFRAIADIQEIGTAEVVKQQGSDGKWRVVERGVRYGKETFEKKLAERGIVDQEEKDIAFSWYTKTLDHYAQMKEKLINARKTELEGAKDGLARAIKMRTEIANDPSASSHKREMASKEIDRLEKVVKDLDEGFETMTSVMNNVAYVPLQRRGSMRVVVREGGQNKKASKKTWVFYGENLADINRQINERIEVSPDLKKLVNDPNSVKQQTEYQDDSDNNINMTFTQINRLAQEANMSDSQITDLTNAVLSLKNMHTQREHMMERKGYRGAIHNILESFDLYIPGYANAVARGNFAHQQEEAFRQIPANNRETRAYLTNLESAMRAQNTALESAAQTIKAFNFLWRIGGRPVMLLQQYAQRITHTFPMLLGDYGMDAVKNLCRPGNSIDRAAGAIATGIAKRAVGMKGEALTRTQLDNIITPELVKEFLVKDSEGNYASDPEAVSNALKGLIWQEYETGIFLDSPTTEFNEGKAGGSKFHSGLKSVTEKFGVFMQYGEAWNRAHALMVAGILSLDRGVPKHWDSMYTKRVNNMRLGMTASEREDMTPSFMKVTEYVHDFVLRSQLPAGSKVYRSAIERNRSLGPIMLMAMQFKSFGINTIENFKQQYLIQSEYYSEIADKNGLKGKDKTAFVIKNAGMAPLMGLAMNTMLSGVAGVPMMMTAMAILSAAVRAIGDDDKWDAYRELLKWMTEKFGFKTAKVFRDGFPNIVGVDMGSMFRQELMPTIPQDPTALKMMAATILGPTAAMFEDVQRASDMKKKGRYQEAAEAISPLGLRRPIRAAADIASGTRTIAGTKHEPDVMESLAYGVGLNTSKRSLQGELVGAKMEAREKRKDLLDYAANRYARTGDLTNIPAVNKWNDSVMKDPWLRNDPGMYIRSADIHRAYLASSKAELGATKGQFTSRESAEEFTK